MIPRNMRRRITGNNVLSVEVWRLDATICSKSVDKFQFISEETDYSYLRCRCGFEFCYACGAKWKTCRRKIWRNKVRACDGLQACQYSYKAKRSFMIDPDSAIEFIYLILKICQGTLRKLHLTGRLAPHLHDHGPFYNESVQQPLPKKTEFQEPGELFSSRELHNFHDHGSNLFHPVVDKLNPKNSRLWLQSPQHEGELRLNAEHSRSPTAGGSLIGVCKHVSSTFSVNAGSWANHHLP